MATKLEGGGGGKALVAGPLKKDRFFSGFPYLDTFYGNHNLQMYFRPSIWFHDPHDGFPQNP